MTMAKSDETRGFGWEAGANGDMAYNETASFDPIFFFLHCDIGTILTYIAQELN